MPTTALYHWSVAGSPVQILIDLPLVDRLRSAALASSDSEMGGLLLGHFDEEYTVVTDFEEVESEHKRGPAYTLSTRDEARLGTRSEAHRKKGPAVVGFFRSHLRPGLYLDEADHQLLAGRFNNPNQIALLVRPKADRSVEGGFFFWEDGEMNRKQTYLTFPMSARELEMGDFPLLEPVESTPRTVTPSVVAPVAFDQAETLDVPHPAAVRDTPLPLPPRREPQPEPAAPRSRKSLIGPLIGLLAGAAIAGYVFGTSGSHRDRFGARPGDIALDSSPPPPVETPPPAAVTPTAPAPTATESAPPVTETATRPTPMPAVPSKPVTPPVLTASRKPATNMPRPAPQTGPVTPGSSSPGARDDGWQRFGENHGGQPTPSLATETAVATPAPAPVVPSAPRIPQTESSVYLEAVEAGSVSRAVSKIPLFGAFHHAKAGENYTPPQAVRSFAPKVPKDLARELTGTLPVDLRLTVDHTGHVSSVEVLSRQSPDEFVRLAGEAAYGWQFDPARLKDKAVSSDVIAHFRFRPVL